MQNVECSLARDRLNASKMFVYTRTLPFRMTEFRDGA